MLKKILRGKLMCFSQINKDYLYSARIDKSSYIEFQSPDESMEWGNKFYAEWGSTYLATSKKMNGLELGAYCEAPIECFCGYGYLSENENLRGNKDVKYCTGLTNVLIREICSAPAIPENIVVYRLVCDDVIQELTTIRNDKPYTYYEKGFMSTSLLKSIVDSEEPYSLHKNLLKIYIDKNTIGVYVNAVTRRSEEEILFLPRMSLGLISKPYKDKEIGKIIYECVLLGGKCNFVY